MKWERVIASAVLLLFLVLVLRGLWLYKGEERGFPAAVETDQPFYAVYFAASDGVLLEPEFKKGESTISGLLDDLIQGPGLPGLERILPAETKVLGYSRQGHVLYVNFSHHLRADHPGGSRAELLTVYGIVNTLVETDGIEQVQILVEYEPLDTLAGHVQLQKPLKGDYTMLGRALI